MAQGVERLVRFPRTRTPRIGRRQLRDRDLSIGGFFGLCARNMVGDGVRHFQHARRVVYASDEGVSPPIRPTIGITDYSETCGYSLTLYAPRENYCSPWRPQTVCPSRFLTKSIWSKSISTKSTVC